LSMVAHKKQWRAKPTATVATAKISSSICPPAPW
jgi:hypothetical protein